MLDGKILIVDDTVENLEVVSQVLEDAGYEVATAMNGERALKLASNHPPDLILLDVQMPIIDGFETCQRLKANPKTATIPVIFMTVLSDTDSKVKGFDLGGVDYITKPFQEKELLARVKTHLQLRQWSQKLENRVAERTRELRASLEQLHESQLQLVQSEKMSILGSLVAGVAHEINNPISFLQGNIQPTQNYLQTLLHLIDFLLAKCPSNDPEIANEIEAIDLEFIREDVPKLLWLMNVGIERIRNISNSLRNFSRKDKEEKTPSLLHKGIDSTLLILKHRTKANKYLPGIEIITDYGDIPEVQCFPGQMNQVFMNILANAFDAFDEVNQGKTYAEIEKKTNQIKIRTSIVDENQVKIEIEDNAGGMKPETKARIFEQGFTTKEVGKGTGLGMAIAHQIITEKHGGKITCESTVGQGTRFAIVLPIV